MHACPERNCKYRTPHAKNMDRHRVSTGHGTTAKEFKGYKQTPKKGGSDSGNGGGKKGKR